MTTTSVYLARELNTIPAHSGHTLGSVIGIANPLDVADGETGYVSMERTDNVVPPHVREITTFRIAHDGVSPLPQPRVVAVRYEVEYEVTGDPFPINWGMSVTAVLADTISFISAGEASKPTTWTFYTINAGMYGDERDNLVLHPDTHFRINASAAQTNNTTGYLRVTLLRVLIDTEGGFIPTRVYPRADGLGMGAPRIMDGRSPYRSPRVFGQI